MLPRSLSARFFAALVLVGIVPLGVMGMAVAAVNHEALVEQSSGELVGLARGLASQLDLYLDLQLSTCRAIASLPTIRGMDPEQQELTLKELLHHHTELSRISTFDLSGARLASSHPGGTPSIAGHAAFQEAVRRGQQVWTVGDAVSTGRPSLLITTPIRDAERRVVGMLRVVIDLETMSAALERVPPEGGRRAFVLDGEGRVVAHPDPSAVRERRDLSALKLSGNGRLPGPGTARYTIDSEARVAGYAPVPNTLWTVVVDRSEADVFAPAERSHRLALIGLATSVLLAMLVAILLSRTLTRPVQKLAAAARAIGAGDLSVPLPAAGGEVGALVASFRDMRHALAQRTAERDQVEQALRASNRTLQSLVQREHEARSQAEAAVRARDEFLSVAAHELKTPITSLMAMAQLSLRQQDRDGRLDLERAGRALRLINDQAGKLSRLVTQLLDLSRIESGRLRLELQRTDITSLLRSVVMAGQIRTAKHHIALRAPDGPLLIYADPLRLEQVLTNLLENAIRYSPSGGEVEVTLTTGDPLRIAVRDRGLGIPPEHRARIFDRFYQAHANDHFSGMGLGLYVSRQIVELHGGQIDVEFPEDGGTRFIVRLPNGATSRPAAQMVREALTGAESSR